MWDDRSISRAIPTQRLRCAQQQGRPDSMCDKRPITNTMLFSHFRCGAQHACSEIGFPPALYYKATVTDTANDTMMGQTAQSCPKEKRENKRKKCEQHRLNESCSIPQPLRPPENAVALQCPRIAEYQAAPSRRTAMTTTLLPGQDNKM